MAVLDNRKTGMRILLGVVVLVSGRNLWIAIIAHGLFDASRSILFYFQGPPHS